MSGEDLGPHKSEHLPHCVPRPAQTPGGLRVKVDNDASTSKSHDVGGPDIHSTSLLHLLDYLFDPSHWHFLGSPTTPLLSEIHLETEESYNKSHIPNGSPSIRL